MPRETQSKIINGNKWEVTPWDGLFGIKMQARIVPMLKGVAVTLANAVGSAKSGEDPMELLMNMDASKLVDAIFDNIDEKGTPQLITDMLYGARVEGRDMGMQKNFDEHFSANYKELYQGLWFVIEVNFGDLFSMAAPTGTPESAAD